MLHYMSALPPHTRRLDGDPIPAPLPILQIHTRPGKCLGFKLLAALTRLGVDPGRASRRSVRDDYGTREAIELSPRRHASASTPDAPVC